MRLCEVEANLGFDKPRPGYGGFERTRHADFQSSSGWFHPMLCQPPPVDWDGGETPGVLTADLPWQFTNNNKKKTES